MKSFIIVIGIVLVSGCATVSDTIEKGNKEMAKAFDNYCLNLSESQRLAEREALNGLTKVATVTVICE